MMTVHKLSAGDGYTYLTRQVASADQGRRGQALADYYTDSGTPPGRWVGAGAQHAGIAGVVREDQMRALFGRGEHPVSEAPLGARFPAATADRKPVAGYDLVFTPVKSVSLLWALGDRDIRASVEAAHHAAVADVLSWIEQHAAFTRVGRGGPFQVEAYGLIAAAFDHFESRAGDPDLHTHVAVANKVRARLDRVDDSPRWLALDGKALFAIGVAASERYNTRLEDQLRARLPVRFEPRLDGRRTRPVRELAGIPLSLVDHFSSRRRDIASALRELEQRYRDTHHREPSRAQRLRLAQEATLATRDAKPHPQPLAQLRRRWRTQAAGAIGAQAVVQALDAAVQQPIGGPTAAVDVAAFAEAVLSALRDSRSSWTRWNLLAEVERQTRSVSLRDPAQREQLVSEVLEACRLHRDTVHVPAGPGSIEQLLRLCGVDSVEELPSSAHRSDGHLVSAGHAAERYTSRTLLDAELDLVDAGAETALAPLKPAIFENVARAARRRGDRVSEEQLVAARHLCLSPTVLACLVGPAGTGKTTTLRVASAAWRAGGRRVVALAPSSAAAQVLGDELGLPADNLHKWLHDNATIGQSGLRRGDIVLVDEAGMAGTLRLAAVLIAVRTAGASVRLIGDPQQLTAVEAGGAFRLLTTATPTSELTTLHRFVDPAEARATMAIRSGDVRAADHYTERKRVVSGDAAAMTEAVFAAWRADTSQRLHSLMLTLDREQARGLNQRAQVDRQIHGTVDARGGVELHDGTRAGVGDWIVTRANARMLQTSRGSDFVKNGDAWIVRDIGADGSLLAQRRGSASTVRLPAAYVRRAVELGYAVTVHRAQGLTCDTAHATITDTTSREQLYVAVSRARQRSHIYLARDTDAAADDAHDSLSPFAAPDQAQVLADCIGRSTAEPSAVETLGRGGNATVGALPPAIAPRPSLSAGTRAPN
jgi:conjugative relaxase-like TrwC/TraI family protein